MIQVFFLTQKINKKEDKQNKFFIGSIKCFMEKIVASKRTNKENFLIKNNNKTKNGNQNQKSSKIKNSIKNISKTIKNSHFFAIIHQNYINFIVLFVFLILTITLCLITFLRSEFYIFVARPKVLKSSAVVIFLILFLAISVFAFYTLNVSFRYKVGLQKNHDSGLELYNSKNKKSRVKIFKSDIAKYIFLFCCLCLLFLFFSTKVLSICAIVSFFIAVTVFWLFVCSKLLWQRLFSLAILLDSVCLFLSFYFVFLLNWQILPILEYFRKNALNYVCQNLEFLCVYLLTNIF